MRVGDPPIISEKHHGTILDRPGGDFFASGPALVNILPSLGGISVTHHAILTIFAFQDFNPNAFRLMDDSLGKTHKKGTIFKRGSLDANCSINFRKSHIFPRDRVNFSFLINRSPDKIPNDSVNMFQNLMRDGDILHDMVRNAAKRSLGKDGSSSHVKELGFPSSKFVVEGIQDEIEILVPGL